MRSRDLGLVTLVIAISCALIATTVPAGAHEFEARTRAEIEDGGPEGASGNVGSRVAACERNRLVTLMREQDGPDARVGTDRTDRAGLWEVQVALSAATYYVVVRQRLIELEGHRHWCRAGRSLRVQL